MKSGFVSIVGRPNVGKSTLINQIMQRKIAIVSTKVGTTRNNIFGIYNDKDYQIVFVDTPGIQKANTKLEEVLNKKALDSFDNDIVLFLIDAITGYKDNDKKILKKLKEDKKRVILVLNKIDQIKKEKLLTLINELKNEYDFLDIVPISSLKNDNIDTLLQVIKNNLQDNVKYFSDDVITNIDEKYMIGELIREKVLENTYDEVPHSVTCLVTNIEFTKGKAIINADIIVDRDNLKSIIIGKNGTMLKKIGKEARLDIENYLNKKVYLELYVKTIPNWRDKKNSLKELNIIESDFE